MERRAGGGASVRDDGTAGPSRELLNGAGAGRAGAHVGESGTPLAISGAGAGGGAKGREGGPFRRIPRPSPTSSSPALQIPEIHHFTGRLQPLRLAAGFPCCKEPL